MRDVYPLPGFVRRFRELTRLEWFLTADERADLERLERFVAAYESDAAIRSLSTAFVDGLERTLRGSERERTRGTRSDDRIDVMTVHQAKGLEFDTVLVPYLRRGVVCRERLRRARPVSTARGDARRRRRLAVARRSRGRDRRRGVAGAPRRAHPCRESPVRLRLPYEYDGGEDELGVSTAQGCLHAEIEWSVAGERMALWSSLSESFERVRESYPDTVADRTDAIARSADSSPGTITYYAGYDDRSVEPSRRTRRSGRSTDWAGCFATGRCCRRPTPRTLSDGETPSTALFEYRVADSSRR